MSTGTIEEQRPVAGAQAPSVLLVEDNRMNQVVGQAMLERLGCAVTLAGNGLEALAALEQGSFDLILMDCQMPELDGYQASRGIREREQQEGKGRRIPIVALTAHALEENWTQCHAAGMDDHISKPLSRAKLEEVLQRWLPERQSAGPAGCAAVQAASQSAPGSGGSYAARPAPQERTGAAAEAEAGKGPAERPAVLEEKVLDAIRALQRANGVNLLDKVIGHYLAEAPRVLAQLERALAAGDPKGLASAAHGFKSSSANVGALRLAALCAELEQLGRSGELGAARQLLPRLAAENAAVCDALSALRSGPAG